MKKKKTEILKLRIDTELKKAFFSIADNPSDVIRGFIIEYVRNSDYVAEPEFLELFPELN